MTTGDFKSAELLAQESALRYSNFDNSSAIALGEFALRIAKVRKLPIAIEIRIGDWKVFKAALPGSSINNDDWLERKARVVSLTHHSTMYERVKAEEDEINWHVTHGVTDETHAIHGGGIPIFNESGSHVATLLISGLPQVDDHMLGIEILTGFITR